MAISIFADTHVVVQAACMITSGTYATLCPGQDSVFFADSTSVSAGSMHGSHQYLRATAKDRAVEREKHRKAARLALDTSAHAGSHYHDFMRDSYNKVSSCAILTR